MKLFVGLLFLVATALMGQERPLDYDQVRSDESFRDGVAAYQSGLYGKAILAFEESLRWKPAAIGPRKWLGEALWASGLDEQALNEWHHVLETGVQDDVLSSWVEVVEQRRSLDADLRTPDRYLPLYELSGKAKDSKGKNLFLRPSSVHALPDGGFLLTAFGSEEVVQIDAMGNMVRRLVGTVGGIRAPFDLVRWNDKVYVSEFTTDQIVVLNTLGIRVGVFGKKGRGDGEFLGPQYMATDGDALYVTDWGNARVSKFDKDGNFLLSFGQPAVGFEGLKGPTGIAVSGGVIYVADKTQKAIFGFDASGNWLSKVADGQVRAPEGLTAVSDGRLLVSDGTRVVFLDPQSDAVVPFDQDWNQGLNVTSAALDANNNLLVADFDDNKIRVLAEGQTIYSGLAARILRVNTKNYPTVTATFTVEDRWGRPITGLSSQNFQLAESGVRVVNTTLSFQGFRSSDADVALVIDRNPDMARFEQDLRDAVGFFTQSWADKGGVGIFAASSNPVPQNEKLTGVRENQDLAANPATLTPQGRFDLALRQAATSLIPGQSRRTIVYITSGGLSTKAFTRTTLSETAALLKNNGLVFSVVSVSNGPVAPELDYLMKATGGTLYSSDRPLDPFLSDVQERVMGTYSLTWKSITPPESGNREIPLTVEVQKFKQSARTESSFFAPRVSP